MEILETDYDPIYTPRINNLNKSMRRLQHVIWERKHARNKYRKKLEDEYILKMKAKEVEELEKKIEGNPEEGVLPEVELPEISFELLRSKWRDMKKGVDNLDYIQNVLDAERFKKQRAQELHDNYGFKGKRVLEIGEEVILF